MNRYNQLSAASASPFLMLSLFCLVAVSSPNRVSAEPRLFAADLTQGDVRCVLMSVGQTTVFPTGRDTASKSRTWSDDGSGVRCLTVTYLVERLGASSLQQVHVGAVEFLTADVPLKIKGHGSYRKVFDYKAFQNFLDFALPKVSDSRRAVIVQDVRFGAIPNSQAFDIVIEAGFGQEPARFRFNAIRLQ